MTWHMNPVPAIDIFDEIKESLTGLSPLEREMRIAAYTVTMEMAARGDLDPEGTDIGPIILDPSLFELRWNFGRRLFRLCHAEPTSLPSILIGLHFHEKAVTGLDHEIREAQDAQISLAALRYRAGERNNWGLAL
ncbi:hypothetical protein QCD70_13940 [Agreia sp. PsM10]|uniref:hypothetical protein n=1 Tax=Agreia sp. PsM10 TaxID=3030533 RepID=UPI00263A9BE2|nr:hypothetical protein [Agreia sp. PsM10]MDN4641354.1 hypothetical protein [Agreia sp. PsM10]